MIVRKSDQEADRTLRSLPKDVRIALMKFLALSTPEGDPVRFDEIAYLKAAALLNRQRRKGIGRG